MQGFVEEKFLVHSGVFFFDHAIAAPKNVDMLTDVADLEQAGLNAVVEIGGKVGDLVSEVDQLRFKRRALIEKILG